MTKPVTPAWPVPFDQFVVKVHSRCNLACDYCYVYETADQSWRALPRRMTARTVDHTIRCIAEHVETHALSRIRVILHGGEPLLAGGEFLTDLVRRVRAATPAQVDIGLQTNGVLLTEELLQALTDCGIRIGISLDGDPDATVRHRRFRDGRTTYDAVARALNLLRQDRFRSCYGGILCTIDVANDPIATYEALLAFAPPAIDLLLPHGTWSDPPSHRSADRRVTPYADWLLAIFDRWYDAPVLETSIRLFDEIIQLVLGGVSGVEGVGLRPSTVIIVETDGAIRQLDSLSMAFPGAPELGLNVQTDAFDAALLHPLTVARQDVVATLCDTCRSCPVVRTCGGGLFTHRYRAGRGFANPSVYCADLYRTISYIRDRVDADMSR